MALLQALPLVVFRSVRCIDPASGLDAVADVVLETGWITRVGPGAGDALVGWPSARVVEGAGRWLLPALVEIHAHLREPGFEHKEDIGSGLLAAAAGGYARVCAMPNTRPVNDVPAVTRLLLERGRESGGPSLHPVSAVTLGSAGEALVDMQAQRNAGAVAFSDDGRCVTAGDVMLAALERARDLDAVVIQHAEDHALTGGAVMNEGATSGRLGLRGWPREAEESIVRRDIALCASTRARYHVAHVSTRGTVALVREAKARGVRVTAEVAPHHLLLDDSVLETRDAVYKVNPPLREPEDCEALVRALADGAIDCVATDHAPHAAHEKALGLEAAPPGMVGLETCLPLVLGLVREGRLSLERAVVALSCAPARVVGLEAPAIRQGARANLCLVDPDASYVLEPSMLRSKGKNSPFFGRALRGRVELSMAGGCIAFERR
jgi:dihydroorotase